MVLHTVLGVDHDFVVSDPRMDAFYLAARKSLSSAAGTASESQSFGPSWSKQAMHRPHTVERCKTYHVYFGKSPKTLAEINNKRLTTLKTPWETDTGVDSVPAQNLRGGGVWDIAPASRCDLYRKGRVRDRLQRTDLLFQGC